MNPCRNGRDNVVQYCSKQVRFIVKCLILLHIPRFPVDTSTLITNVPWGNYWGLYLLEILGIRAEIPEAMLFSIVPSKNQ